MPCLSSDDFMRLSEPDSNAYWREDVGRPAYYDERSPYYGKPTFRQNIAKEQSKLKPASIDKIIALTNEILVAGGNKAISEPKIEGNFLQSYLTHYKDKEFYEEQLNSFGIKDSSNYKDLVWMRFTDSGHLGVVGASNDITFPATDNNSYEIIRFCKMEWDKSFQLIFPLTSTGGCWNKISRTETAVGNYLIENAVPIIDFYSHNY